MNAGSNDFLNRLKEELRYETVPGPRPWLTRLLYGWPTLAYNLGVLRVVLRSSRLSRAGRFDSRQFAESSYMTLMLVEKCGGRISISGLEHVARVSGPVVFVANHMSLLETFVLQGIVHPFKVFALVIKSDLLRYPILGDVMRVLPTIAVGRKDARKDLEQALEKGQAYLKSGLSVVMFPQATRSEVFDPRRFNSLGAKLAARAEVPLIPVALKTDFQANGKLVKDFGRVRPDRPVHFKFGPALKVEGNGRAQHRQAVDFIASNLRSWGGIVAESPESGEAQP